MKHYCFHFFFLTFILFYVSSYANDGKPSTDIGFTSVEETFHIYSPIQLEYESFSLSADTGALIHDLTIYVEPLSSKKTADMSVEMVNVTGANSDAYRLLPNGTHFSTPAIITIPYDEYNKYIR